MCEFCRCLSKRAPFVTDCELENEGLTVFDIEETVLSGNVVERQKDRVTGDWKYLVRGWSLDGSAISVVGKIGPTAKLVVITVFVG